MAPIGSFGGLLCVLAICSFCPGFFILRRFRWTPLEKLTGSVGLSLLLQYQAVWATYCFGPRDQRPVYRAIVAVAAILGVLAWRDTAALFRTFRVRQTVLVFLLCSPL